MVRTLTLTCVFALAAATVACDEVMTEPEGPFTLVFSGDASFNGPHGGQTIRAALVPAGGTTAETQTATVSADADPAFTFTFIDELEEGQAYEFHYWIDSNFGGGGEDVCDTKDIDHQWNESVAMATEDVDITVSHDAAATEAVCETFAFDLTFSGDASFQGAHGGQMAHVALVRSSDGTVLVTDQGTVSSGDDPAFSFSFPTSLLPDQAYEVHLWIDSNFSSGTEGTCDPPENDHQWNIDVGTPTGDVAISYDHDPTMTTDVCASFS